MSTLKLEAIGIILFALTLRMFKSEFDCRAGIADVLRPLQMDPTDLSREGPHLDFDNSANIQNGNTFDQGEMNESEAA